MNGDGSGPSPAVAIVGLGPKGLYALEALLHASSAHNGPPLVVDVFEPHRVPGAGPVYDPGQPPYLRMNFSADLIDMWRPVMSGGRRRSFVAWWRAAHDGADPPAYPARADVGRYLADGLGIIEDEAPAGVHLALIAARATAVRRLGARWSVEIAGGHTRAVGHAYDEVLIATGHEGRWSGALSESWNHRAPLVRAVFPTTRHLTERAIPPGSTVAIRGFGLTFIDAALALTEGRGGRFEPVRGRDGLRFVAGAQPPPRILPFSRTGRPMMAKADPGRIADLEATIAPHLALLFDLKRPPDLDRDVLPAVAGAAAEILARDTNTPPDGMVGLRHMLHARLERMECGEGETWEHGLEALRRSVAIGMGRAPLDATTALGQSWRSLFPALSTILGHGVLGPADRTRFVKLSAEMERISFGPPCTNAMKLLALIDAGVVDPRLAAGGQIQSDATGSWLVSPTHRVTVDVVVDAVLPPPGLPEGGTGIAHQVVRDGYARRVPGGRGIDVLPGAECVGVDGNATPGLSAVGRPTEDAVLGNDTLSRTMHRHPERWAARVADRLCGRLRVPTSASAGR